MKNCVHKILELISLNRELLKTGKDNSKCVHKIEAYVDLLLVLDKEDLIYDD